MARPSKFTADVRAKILKGLRDGMNTKEACAYAGISYETLKKWNQGTLPKGARVSSQRFLEDQEHARSGRKRTRDVEEWYLQLEEEAADAGIEWEDHHDLLKKLDEHRAREEEKYWRPFEEEAAAAGIEWEDRFDLIYRLDEYRFQRRMEFLDKYWNGMEPPEQAINKE